MNLRSKGRKNRGRVGQPTQHAHYQTNLPISKCCRPTMMTIVGQLYVNETAHLPDAWNRLSETGSTVMIVILMELKI